MSARLVLVGPPGSGKSTVGRLLAERWDVPFLDTDDVVEEAAGMAVADIFIVDGEPAFREIEESAVVAALQSDAVVALGGGAIVSDHNRERLSGHTVVLLQTSSSTLVSRVGMNRDRPLLIGNVRGQLAQLLRDRAPLYKAVATLTVDTDGLDASAVADEVMRAVAEVDS